MRLPTMERRTAFMYIADNRVGKETVRVDADTLIRFNWYDAPEYMKSVLDHAKHNGGRVLIPFNSTIAPRSLKLCTYFVIWRRVDDEHTEYIKASLYDAGENYIRGMDMKDGFTAPKDFHMENASRWVKLFELEHGVDFPFGDYTKLTYTPTGSITMNLADVVQQSKNNVIIALQNDPGEE